MNPPITKGPARACRVATRGFSLIEVLIAVVVLGIGLLGLASVFPVVITQQREATDVIRGGVASGAIRDQIRSNPDIAQELLSQDGFVDAGERDSDGDRAPNDQNDSGLDNNNDGIPDGFAIQGDGEPIFGQDGQYVPGSFQVGVLRFDPLSGYSYLWEADWQWGTNNGDPLDGPLSIPMAPGGLDRYRQTGGVWFRDPEERRISGVGNAISDLPMQARLYPRSYSNTGESRDGPLYVWDFVPRRTPRGSVQMAVFVRRIDTGIRVPAGLTLTGVLSAAGNQVFAVGRDPATRLPTLDGTGEYSVPVSAEAIPIPSQQYPFRPEFRGTPALPVLLDGVRILRNANDGTEVGTVQTLDELRSLAQTGQRFVDNLGTVRTVVEVLGENPDSVDLRVEPAYTLNQLAPAFGAGQLNTIALREAARAGKLRQVVFTPHEPVDVFVMEFNQ
jgi:prepilin-type N-terminal cleavage/methylation domain-containing protein